MNDRIRTTNKKTESPIHLIIGANDYTKIKGQEMPRVEKPGELVAELTN